MANMIMISGCALCNVSMRDQDMNCNKIIGVDATDNVMKRCRPRRHGYSVRCRLDNGLSQVKGEKESSYRNYWWKNNSTRSGIWINTVKTYENSADLQMRHQKLCTLARHFSVGHFA